MRRVCKMTVASTVLACIASAVAAGAQADSSSGKQPTPPAKPKSSTSAPSEDLGNKHFTFWFGGPAILDYRPGNQGDFTVGFGVGPVELSNSSNSVSEFGTTTTNQINISPVGEVFWYPNRKAYGLALNVRVGSANSIYAAPGIFYVSRPKGGVCGRFGVMAPLGGGAVAFLPEIAIGFRF